jgi:hypothetical protein
MSDAKKKQLVDHLVGALSPVRPIHIGRWLSVWGILAALVAIYYLQVVGVREDLSSRLWEPSYLLGLFFYLISFVAASAMMLRLGIPGRQFRSFKMVLAFILSLVSGALFFYGLAGGSPAVIHTSGLVEEFSCCLRIAYGTMIPSVILIFFRMRMYPNRPIQAAAFAWISAAALVSLVSQLNCPIAGMWHVFVGHGVLLGLVGLVAWLILALVFWLLKRKKDVFLNAEVSRLK